MSLGKIQNVFESLSGAQGLSLQFQRKQEYCIHTGKLFFRLMVN